VLLGDKARGQWPIFSLFPAFRKFVRISLQNGKGRKLIFPHTDQSGPTELTKSRTALKVGFVQEK